MVVLEGFPTADDAPNAPTSLWLEALNAKGDVLARSRITVSVGEWTRYHALSHEVVTTLDADFAHFSRAPLEQRRFLRQLADYFHCRAEDLLLLSIASGSVVLSWTNTSLASETCPEAALTTLEEEMLDAEFGGPRVEFVSAMRPFRVVRVRVERRGEIFVVFATRASIVNFSFVFARCMRRCAFQRDRQ